jgi:hypothetical protein
MLATTAAILPVLGQTAARPTLSKSEFALLTELTERIIPKTDTPGAADAGVPAIIDAGLAQNPQRLTKWKTTLAWFATQGKTPAERLRVLERISLEKGTDGSAHFALLKGETIDVYYSTQEGLKTELGWNANTFLDKFPGCTHPEHQS